MILAGTLAGAVEVETTFENSNFLIAAPEDGTGKRLWYDYDRFRATAAVREGNWFATAIGDIEHTLGQDYVNSASYRAASLLRSDTPVPTQTGTTHYGEGELYAQLYRLYGGYADGTHRVSLGLQKVSMGVGRLWNPTDLFNPKNPLALEPDEVYGVLALAYTYSLGELSQLTLVAAEREDHSHKYAGRIKGFLRVADVALNVVRADDVTMVGYEVEGEWGESGIALRSEGGWFHDRLLGQSFFQGIAGVDYTFENSLSLTLEWLHSSRSFADAPLLALVSGTPANLVRSGGYGGVAIGYEFDALLYGTFTTIVSAGDGSRFCSPVLSYSLADDATLGAGALLYGGASGSEFGDYEPTWYVNLKITF